MRATGPQIAYLRRLLIEAFARRYPTAYDYNHLDRVTNAEASEEIERLNSAKSRGWPSSDVYRVTSGPWDHLDDATRERFKQYRKEEPSAHVRVWEAWMANGGGQ